MLSRMLSSRRKSALFSNKKILLRNSFSTLNMEHGMNILAFDLEILGVPEVNVPEDTLSVVFSDKNTLSVSFD